MDEGNIIPNSSSKTVSAFSFKAGDAVLAKSSAEDEFYYFANVIQVNSIKRSIALGGDSIISYMLAFFDNEMLDIPAAGVFPAPGVGGEVQALFPALSKNLVVPPNARMYPAKITAVNFSRNHKSTVDISASSGTTRS